MANHPDPGAYIPNSIKFFSRSYANSLYFKYSSPLSSIIWLSTAFLSQNGTAVAFGLSLYDLTVACAILALLGPAGGYWHINRPFHAYVTWNPFQPEPVDHRLEHKNSLRIREDNDDQISATINVYFDKEVDKYELRIRETGGINATPMFAPGKSVYDEESNTLRCDDVDLRNIYFPLKIEPDEDFTGDLERRITISDQSKSSRNLLEVNVL